MTDNLPVKRGRPTKYTPEIASEICERLANGQSLRSICGDEHMPAEATVRLWAIEDNDGFSAHYSQAREIGYARLAEDILEISDDGRNDWMAINDPENPGYALNGEHVQRSRLRVDSRKWVLSKVLPKVYGDRIETHHTGDRDRVSDSQELLARTIARLVGMVTVDGGELEAESDT